MGIGKTLQTISLILSNRRPDCEKLYSKTTLIVLPVSLIDQWRLEILDKTLPGTLSVYVYHGPQRIKDKKVLREYDIILTSYPTYV
jgi:SNF2 family DNA or RNA helicase